MIIKHGAFVCGDPGYISRGYMAFIVIVFVHHFMEVRLHKNAFAFLSKPPGKCVCARHANIQAWIRSGGIRFNCGGKTRISDFVTFVRKG